MAPVKDRVHHMDAAFGEISDIDAAAVLQYPAAFVKECPPTLHMMKDAKVQNGVKALVCKSAQIVCGYAFTKADDIIRIFNLNDKESSMVIAPDGTMIETNMNEIEQALVLDIWRKGSKYMEDSYA